MKLHRERREKIIKVIFSDQGDLVGLSRTGNVINALAGSVINHSCDPNTIRINSPIQPSPSATDSRSEGTSRGGVMTLFIASRKIKSGEEICDMYSMHYSQVDATHRREFLREKFHFECQCQVGVTGNFSYPQC